MPRTPESRGGRQELLQQFIALHLRQPLEDRARLLVEREDCIQLSSQKLLGHPQEQTGRKDGRNEREGSECTSSPGAGTTGKKAALEVDERKTMSDSATISNRQPKARVRSLANLAADSKFIIASSRVLRYLSCAAGIGTSQGQSSGRHDGSMDVDGVSC